ncbi:hypothetical protein QYE76_065741 [Lolium multiflorum]|uniref:Fungal lipase-type domain-containing protein n=1 Tax=Lolium multiflorum TaxID=4521 RepID=A0AAD8SAN7_LOLMU|nr:hypothetical protein QYE76_065741 [Lolium multiflorum]
MGAKRVASSAAGTAALVYVVLSGRLSSDGAEKVPRRQPGRKDVEGESEERWPETAPVSWREAAAVAARTVGFAYGETLGKWPLGDIAFGISHYMRLQGNLQHEYTGSNCVPLEGPGVRQELMALLRCLRLCMFFSKKPFEVFLEFGGYDQSDILTRNCKAKLMKPKFTVVRDESTRCFLLFIRGAISVKDRLTAATATEVPFHHAVSQEGRGTSVVVGHAHCGMVAAARWIADQAIPCISRAVELFPDYRIKIIGHSMGAAIAAILTCILRENKKLSSSSCIAFGPAACMTWDLAESSKDFVTTVVNKNDLVPSFGKVSASGLRAEVMASSWAPDLREHIQQKRILSFVNHSVNFMRSYVPFVHNPSSKVADIESYIAKSESEDMRYIVKKHSALSCWPYVAAGKQTLEAPDTEEEEGTAGEETEQLMEALQSAPDAAQAPSHRQLYPPGRIIHMVELPESEEQGGQNAGVALYETPRGVYGKIRLSGSMIRDHYMPRYVETMEMLIDRLAEDDDAPLSDTNDDVPLD